MKLGFDKWMTRGKREKGRARGVRSSIGGIKIRQEKNTGHSAEERVGDRMDKI